MRQTADSLNCIFFRILDQCSRVLSRNSNELRLPQQMCHGVAHFRTYQIRLAPDLLFIAHNESQKLKKLQFLKVAMFASKANGNIFLTFFFKEKKTFQKNLISHIDDLIVQPARTHIFITLFFIFLCPKCCYGKRLLKSQAYLQNRVRFQLV